MEEAIKRLGADWERLDSAKSDFKIVGLAAGIVAIFGFVLGSYGFYNWRKLQLKQDQLEYPPNRRNILRSSEFLTI
jgi:hypothetical protein